MRSSKNIRKNTTKEKYSKFSFLKGAAWIATGGFVAKLIGALYRIPLTNLIGGHGMGLYQMVYPVYCLLLTVSATGIPSSIAKLTAERIGKNKPTQPLFKTALRLFLIIGGVGSVLMAVIAPYLSKAQGSEEVLWGYYTLAPSVFLVSAISVFRGYFQGRNEMYPTALSEITEQAVKVGFGLFFAKMYRGNVGKAVVFLLLAVSLSELAALLLMMFLYKRRKKRDKKRLIKEESQTDNAKAQREQKDRVSAKTVLRLSIPVTFSSILLPLSGLLDSVLAPRLMSAYAEDAVALFGLFSGGAVTIINLPVSVCYGIAAASVPAVASAKKPRKKIFFSLWITLLVAIPSVVGLYFFAEPAAKIIFRSLTGAELQILTKLVKIFSVSALTLSCVQTLSACLTAQGKPHLAAISMLIAVTVKTLVYQTLLKNADISVFGLAYATNICYLVAFLLDLLYNLRVSRIPKRKRQQSED